MEQEYVLKALENIALALTISLRKRDIEIYEGQPE